MPMFLINAGKLFLKLVSLWNSDEAKFLTTVRSLILVVVKCDGINSLLLAFGIKRLLECTCSHDMIVSRYPNQTYRILQRNLI